MEPEVLGLALIRDIKSQGGESDPPSAGLNFGVEYENAGTASESVGVSCRGVSGRGVCVCVSGSGCTVVSEDGD